MSSNNVWEDYCTFLKGDKRHGGDGDGNKNERDTGYVQETDEKRERNYSLPFIFDARSDASIKTVKLCVV